MGSWGTASWSVLDGRSKQKSFSAQRADVSLFQWRRASWRLLKRAGWVLVASSRESLGERARASERKEEGGKREVDGVCGAKKEARSVVAARGEECGGSERRVGGFSSFGRQCSLLAWPQDLKPLPFVLRRVPSRCCLASPPHPTPERVWNNYIDSFLHSECFQF